MFRVSVGVIIYFLVSIDAPFRVLLRYVSINSQIIHSVQIAPTFLSNTNPPPETILYVSVLIRPCYSPVFCRLTLNGLYFLQFLIMVICHNSGSNSPILYGSNLAGDFVVSVGGRPLQISPIFQRSRIEVFFYGFLVEMRGPPWTTPFHAFL